MSFVFLAFLYVANDVIQHDKRKGGEFVKDFLPMLPSAVQHIVSQLNDENIHKTVKRIINIWGERQIYQADAIKLLKTSFESGVRLDDSLCTHDCSATDKQGFLFVESDISNYYFDVLGKIRLSFY